jgi:RNA polymerase primary sigma factor
MTTGRPSAEMARFADLDSSDVEVLSPRLERELLRELAECKSKLAKALSSIEGIDARPATDDPQTLAQFIANAFSGDGPEQASLGAVYHRYSELRGKLAMANLKLVAHVAKRFRDRGIPYHDLMQEGFCGMLEAIDRFNMTHETKLATYATWWIRQSMQRAVASGAYPVRLTPRHLRQLAQNQEQKDGRHTGTPDVGTTGAPEPTETEIISRIHAATRPTVSLDATYHSSSNFSLLDTMSDPVGDQTTEIDTDETVDKLMQVLRPREQQVVSLRFGLRGQERLSLTQVGRLLDVSKERVRQIEERALKKLRASVEHQEFALED